MKVETDLPIYRYAGEMQPSEEMLRVFDEIRQFGEPLEEGPYEGVRFYLNGDDVSYYPQEPRNKAAGSEEERLWERFVKESGKQRVSPWAPLLAQYTNAELEVVRIGSALTARVKVIKVSDDLLGRGSSALVEVIPWRPDDNRPHSVLEVKSGGTINAHVYTHDWDGGRWSFHIDKRMQLGYAGLAAKRS